MNDEERLAYVQRMRAQVANQVAGTVRTAALVTTIVGIAFMVAGAGVLVFGLISLAGKGGTVATVTLIVGPAVILFGLIFFVVGRRVAPDETRLLASGLPGRATLIEVGRGGMTVRSGSGVSAQQSELHFEVQLEDGRPAYRVKHRTFVPLGSVSSLRPGTSFVVRVDPARPAKLAVVWDQP